MLKNTGCKYHDDCSTCPFPDCYEGSLEKVKCFYRTQEVAKLWDKGFSIAKIARKFKLCRRTIQRDLEKVR